MLVLSRQINESIMIGDSIEVTIVDVKGDKVRIGITAPRDVPVHRKEVYLAILEENLAASKHADFTALADIGDMFPQHPPKKTNPSGRHPKQDKPGKS
ncbi:MAG: carbon storage regulator CsrA [Planctomycetes bacterium]|nr:carbon storage regulator CsrA [Planctomycetota bacterium]